MTPTVEQARRAFHDVIAECGFGKEFDAAEDALILAVRAEQQETVDRLEQELDDTDRELSRHCACTRDDAGNRVERCLTHSQLESRAEQAEQQLAAARATMIAQVKALLGSPDFWGDGKFDDKWFIKKLSELHPSSDLAVLTVSEREQALEKITEAARMGYAMYGMRPHHEIDAAALMKKDSGAGLIHQPIPDVAETEPRPIWDCRVCGFGVVQGPALEYVRQNGYHRNALGNDSPNAGIAYCPYCTDETLRSPVRSDPQVHLQPSICMTCDGTGWCEGSPAFTCPDCGGNGSDLPVVVIENVMEALADNLETVSDADILHECREAGEDPTAVAARTRGTIQRAIQDFDNGKRRIVAPPASSPETQPTTEGT